MTKKPIDGKRGKRIGRKVALALLLPVVAVFAYFSTVPIDISDRIPAFRARVEPNLYGRLEMESAKLTLLPRPTVYIEGFVLTSLDADLIRAGSMHAVINPLPLLYNVYSIKKLVVNDADIFVKRYADGSLNLDKVVKKRMHDVELKRLSIRNGSLRAVDAAPGEEASFAFFDFSADVYESSTGYAYKADGDLMRSATVSVSGDANRGDDGWRLSGSFKSENLDLTLLEPYVKQKRPDADVAGRVDVDSTFSVVKDKATVKGKLGYRDLTVFLSEVFKKELKSKSGNASVEATIGKDTLSLALDEARVNLDDFSVMGSARIGGPPDDPHIKLKLSSSAVDYSTFKRILPEEMLTSKVAARLDAFDVKEGLVAVKELSMDGRRSELKGKEILTDPERLSFTLNFNNFGFKYPAFNKPFTNVTGDVTLKGKDIFIGGLKGLYGETAVVDSLKGEILGLGGPVSYGLDINGSFDATEHLAEMKRFVKELTPVTATGVVGAKIHLGKRDGRGMHSGEFAFKNNTLRHEAVPLTFTGAIGRVTFDPSRVNFLALKGQNQGSDVVMDGSIEFAPGKEPFYRLKLGGNVTDASVASLLKNKRPDWVSLNSPAAFTLDLKGPYGALEAAVNLDLTRALLTPSETVRKVPGFPSSIKGSFKASRSKVTIENADLTLGGSIVKLKGNFYLDSPLYALEMLSNDLRAVDADNVVEFVKDDPGSRGSGTLSLKITKDSAARPAAWSGKLTLSGGVFLTRLLKRPLEDLSLTARFSGRSCEAKIESIKVGESLASGTASFADIGSMKASFDLHAKNLRVEDLDAPVDGKTGKDPARLSASGRLGAAKGSFKGKPFSAFSSDVSLDSKGVKLSSLLVNTDLGRVSGFVHYMTDESEPLLYRADLKLKYMDIARIAESLGAKEQFISGFMDAAMKLEQRRGAGYEGLNGDVSVKSNDGKLWKFIVVSKIFSLVNIFSIDQMFKEGLDYDDISGTFKVKNGLAHTEDFVFASRSLRMSAVGDVDLRNSTIDATLGFHPFVTIDAVISKIPIAGWILAGDDNSTVSMYYKVSGAVKDPVVDPLPAESINKSVFGVLQRLIESPAKIVLPKDDFDKLHDGGKKEGSGAK